MEIQSMELLMIKFFLISVLVYSISLFYLFDKINKSKIILIIVGLIGGFFHITSNSDNIIKLIDIEYTPEIQLCSTIFLWLYLITAIYFIWRKRKQ